jgi:activator of HSP90 ATPase
MEQRNTSKQKFVTVRQNVFFKATPEEVFEALVDAGKRRKWTGQRATGDSKVGSKFTTTDGYVFGRNLEVDRGKLIVQEWKTKEWPDDAPFSIVKYYMKAERRGTRLSLVHSKIPASMADYVKSGWIEYNWEPLESYFASNNKKQGGHSS